MNVHPFVVLALIISRLILFVAWLRSERRWKALRRFVKNQRATWEENTCRFPASESDQAHWNAWGRVKAY